MSTRQLKTFVILLWVFILVVGGAMGTAYFWLESAPPVVAAQPEREMGITPAVPTREAAATHATATASATSRASISKPTFTAYPSNTLPPTLPPKNNQEAADDGFNPLTGLPVEDPSILDRNPIVVKITNFPRRVRDYQYGLAAADVVYEYYIEDGLSRFIAVFYGKDAAKAGPVRSGRYFDEHITRMYHAYLVFANADERVEKHFMESDLRKFLFVPRDDNCPPLCRDDRVKDYNNVFVDTAGVTAFQRKIGHTIENPKLRSTYFNANKPMSVNPISKMIFRYSAYSYHYWQYDPDTDLYFRWADAVDSITVSGEEYAPHVDVLTGEQISARNVVALVVPHNFNNEFDRADQLFNIPLLEAGVAYIFKNGYALTGYWRRDLLDQPIRLMDGAGNPIPLLPGATHYIVINPESNLVQFEDVARFTFFIPGRSATPTPTPPGFVPSPTPRKKNP